MTDKIKAQVSAYLDDELLEAESELLVRRLCADDELRRTAARYALIGGALRGSLSATGHDLGRRIMDAIDGGEAPVTVEPSPGAGQPRRWLRPLAGGAIAATVAGLAVFLVSDPSPQTQPATIAEAVAPSVQPSYTVPARATQTVNAGVDSVRLNQLLVRHSQYATTMGGQGIMTYRTVGFDGGPSSPPADESASPAE